MNHSRRDALSSSSSSSSVVHDTLTPTVAKMDIIIDLQGMRGKELEFIPKEISVVGVKTPLTAHWIIAPPCHFGELPRESRVQNNYLTKFYHGVEWFDGDVACKQAYANLREISRVSRRIYTRGNDKAVLLRDVTSRDIINLEGEENAPSYFNMPASRRRCFRHGLMRDSTLRCAMNQAFRIKKWLRENPPVEGVCKGGWTSDSESDDDEKASDKSSTKSRDTVS